MNGSVDLSTMDQVTSFSFPKTFFKSAKRLAERYFLGVSPSVATPPEVHQNASHTSLLSGPAAPARKRVCREVRPILCQHQQTGDRMPAVISNDTVRLLLKRSVSEWGSTLNDNKIQEVFIVGVYLLSSDPCRALSSQLEQWQKNESQKLHALGIPMPWPGIEAAVQYVVQLNSKRIADPIAIRIAQTLLFLNYAEMCKRPEDFCPRPRLTSEQNETFVLNCIVDVIFGNSNNQKEQTHCRNTINNQVRFGRWWWRLSSALGVGILLIGDDDLLKKMYVDYRIYQAQANCIYRRNYKFTNTQIAALIIYASHIHPGTVGLLRSLISVTRTLMWGQVSEDLISALRTDEPSLSRDLSRARLEDESALDGQNLEIPWAKPDSFLPTLANSTDLFLQLS